MATPEVMEFKAQLVLKVSMALRAKATLVLKGPLVAQGLQVQLVLPGQANQVLLVLKDLPDLPRV